MRGKQSPSIAGRVGRALAAAVAGTAVMTAYQLAVARGRRQPLRTPVPHTWAEAPAPAQLAKKVATATGNGRRLTKKDAPLVTDVMHWSYGVSIGLAYGLATHALGLNPARHALGFGLGVWALGYAELVPLGIYKPPWRYPAKEVALDLSYHLVYGSAVGATLALLDER